MTFIRSPKVVLLDEPCAGLAASHAATLMKLVKRVVRERAVAAIIVEQRIPEVLEIADRVLVLHQGRLVYSGPAAELRVPSRLKQFFLA